MSTASLRTGKKALERGCTCKLIKLCLLSHVSGSRSGYMYVINYCAFYIMLCCLHASVYVCMLCEMYRAIVPCSNWSVIVPCADNGSQAVCSSGN